MCKDLFLFFLNFSSFVVIDALCLAAACRHQAKGGGQFRSALCWPTTAALHVWFVHRRKSTHAMNGSQEWRRRDVVGTPSTDALCYFGPTQCFLSLYHFSLSFILMTASPTRRHAHTDSGCYLKEDLSSVIIVFGRRRRKPAGGAVQCPQVSLSFHPVFRRFHLLTPPSILLWYRIHLLSPSTRIQVRIQREQGAARINADWLIRAADVRRGGVQCWLPLWRRHPREFSGDFCVSEDMQGPCFYCRARSWHCRSPPLVSIFVYSHIAKVSCHQTNVFKIPWRAF